MRQGHVTSVVIAENHVLLRQLIVRTLSRAPSQFRLAGEAASAQAASELCARLKPDLLILSLAMLHQDGEAAIAAIRKKRPSINVLVYSRPGARERDIARAIRIGVNGHIGGECSTAELLRAIRKTGGGDNYFCAASMELLADIARGKHSPPFGANRPSPREIEILKLIAEGHTSKEVAKKLGLSVATVDTHRRNLLIKARARNAAELIRFGREHNLLAPSV